MKAKDIKANMPGYFLTRDNFKPQVVYIATTEERGNMSGWSRSTRDFHTVYIAKGVKLSGDGTDLQVATRWIDKLMPNQVAEAMDTDKALGYLRARRERECRSEYQADMYSKHADAFIAAMVNAGFPAGYDEWKGVRIPKASVVKWCEDQGLTLDGEEG